MVWQVSHRMKIIELFDYQKKYYQEIITSLKDNTGVILAMDTGLGKTYIATRYIQDLIEAFPNVKILVLARKKNLNDPWENLFLKEEALVNKYNYPLYFTYTIVYANKLKPNKKSNADFSDYKVVLTNYETLENHVDDFRCINWNLIIYDEIHGRISKQKALNILNRLTLLNAERQIGLTASPMRNSIKELYYLNSFITNNKTILQIYMEYENEESENLKKLEEKIKGKNKNFKRFYAECILEKQLANKLAKSINKTIFYHSKRDKEIPVLPPLVIRNIYLPLHKSQSAKELLGITKKNMYRLWNNDAVFIETSPFAAAEIGKISLDNSSLEISTKEVFLKKLINYIIDKTEDKIVIFSQFTKILTYFLSRFSNLECIYIEGKTKDYIEKLEKFKNSSNKRIIFISLDAYKEGIDLRCANHVIFLDLPYNPQVLLQAQDRCHRTGQKKNVFVYNLYYQDNFKYSPDKIRTKFLLKKKLLFDQIFNKNLDSNNSNLIHETYSFTYEQDEKFDLHNYDIQHKYENLNRMFDYFFLSFDLASQYKKYLPDYYEPLQFSKFGIVADFYFGRGLTEEDLPPSTFDDLILTT